MRAKHCSSRECTFLAVHEIVQLRRMPFSPLSPFLFLLHFLSPAEIKLPVVEISSANCQYPFHYLHHQGWMVVKFSFLSVCQSVCLSVSRISQKTWTDLDKLGGQVGYVTRMNRLDFAEDPEPDITIFKVIPHH